MSGISPSSPNDADSARSMRRVRMVAVIAFLLAVARYAPIRNDAFNDSVEDRETVAFTGEIVKNWERFGFAAQKGMPIAYATPSEPPEIHDYVRHPPGLFWATYLSVRIFGLTEFALRFLPALAAAASIAAVALLIGRRAGPALAAAAAILYLVDRSGMFFGWMANYESPVFGLGLFALVARDRIEHARAREWPVHVFLAIAVWFDWAGAFFGPALLVYEWMLPKEKRSYDRIFRFAATIILQAALVFVLVAYWKGSAVAGLQALSEGGRQAATAQGEIPGVWAWIRAQGRMLVLHHGLALTIAAAAGLLILVVARRGRAADHRPAAATLLDLGATLLVPGILNVLVFLRRAYDHDFWWYYGNAAVVVFAAGGLHTLVLGFIGDRLGNAARATLVIALAAAIAVPGFLHSKRHYDEFRAQVDVRAFTARLNGALTPEDVIVYPYAAGSERFYLRSFVECILANDQKIDGTHALQYWRSGAFANRRTIVFLPRWILENAPNLVDTYRRAGATYVQEIRAGWFVFLPPLKNAPPESAPKPK